MTQKTIRQHVLEALREAGPGGLLKERLHDLVVARCGGPIRRATITSTVSDLNGSPRLRLHIRAVRDRGTIRYIMQEGVEPVPVVAKPAAVAMPQDRFAGWPASLTGRLLGDPPPGRSAYDRRSPQPTEDAPRG